MRARSASREAAAPDAARPLGEALQALLHRSGVSALLRHPKLHEAWRNTVGAEIAERTRISAFRNGVLEIAVDSSALMNELGFHRTTLLGDLQRVMKKPFVARIAFVLKPVQDDDAEETKPPKR